MASESSAVIGSRMEMKWETVPFRKGRGRLIMPGGKRGHTVNAVRNGRLYVFGGHSSKEGVGSDLKQTQNVNDVFVFNTNNSTWSKLKPKGTPPSPRHNHSSTLVGKDLCVFGGTNGDKTFNDLHILDTFSQLWTTPPVSGDIPPSREGHGAALIDSSLYIFGGVGRVLEDGEQTEKSLNDVYILDTRSFHWTKAETFGMSPAPRNGSTCIAFGEMLIVFGGIDDARFNCSCYADVRVLNTSTMLWKELVTGGDWPRPLTDHTTVTFDKYFLIFGGSTANMIPTNDVYILDLESGLWQKASLSGQKPCPRFAGAGAGFDPKRGLFAFVGGCNFELEVLSDVFYLRTHMRVPLPLDDSHVRAESVLGNEPQEGKSIPVPQALHPSMDDLNHPDTTASDIPTGMSFDAKVTKAFHYGYQVKATIDGKAFRGILFSQNPSHFSAVHKSLVAKKVEQRRKRKAAQILLGKSRAAKNRPDKSRAAKDLPGKSMTTKESAA